VSAAALGGGAAAPAPPPRGLWGHAGLALAPSRAYVLSLVALVMGGYSAAMLITSSATRYLPPRFARARPPADPLAGLGLVNAVADPVFLLAAFRALAAAALCAALVARGDVPPAAPALADRGLRVSFLIGLTNAGGYASFLALTARGGVSLWSALIGLYVCGPVAYGVLRRGEARTPRKLAGVATCVVAGVLLGVGEEQGEAAAGAGAGVAAQNAALFLTSLVLWGICDAQAAYVGRDLHVLYVTAATGAGFAVVAVSAALAGYALSVGAAAAGAPPDAAPPGALSPAAALALLGVGQLAGLGAWFASVRLGCVSEASAFLPITSLYTIGASLAAVPLFGERPPPLYWAGLPLAAAGILLIAFGGGGGDAGAHAVLDEAAKPAPALVLAGRAPVAAAVDEW